MKARPTQNNYLTEVQIGLSKKVGEESVEVVIAAKNDENDKFIGEVADLVYHLLVLLVAKDIKITDIEKRLQERYNNKLRRSRGIRLESRWETPGC